MRLSGDPTLLLVPQGASAEQIQELRHELGFDRPLIVQSDAYLRP
jgi:peptide/nickel transport system permease protein